MVKKAKSEDKPLDVSSLIEKIEEKPIVKTEPAPIQPPLNRIQMKLRYLWRRD
jgi:hypothetical protein